MNIKSWSPTISKWWQSPAIRGLSFMSLFRYGTKAAALLRLFIVVRILDQSGPFQLGTYGLVLLVIAITEVFTQTGINIILIRDKKLLKQYIDTAWVISVVRGFLISTIIWIITPWLSQFFNNPDLIIYLRWSLLVPILRGFINPAIVTYKRDLKFERESLLRTVIQLVDLASGLLLTFIWKSALGLLVGMIIGVVVELVLSFVIFSKRPRPWLVKLSLLKPLFGETRFIIFNGMITYLNENLDDLLIGKLLGSSNLGFYQTAYKLASSATIEIGNLLRDTLYPIYANLVGKPKQFLNLLKQSEVKQTLLNFVVVVFTWIFAQPFVYFVFGEQWLEIVPVLRILIVSGALRGLMNAWAPLFVLAKQVNRNLLVNTVSTLIMILGIVVLAPQYGLVGTSWAILASVAVVFPVGYWWQQQSVKKIVKRG